ncbi:hypothetical protein [Pikeienuella sp. HZG-20]|uniref:phage tail fiber protein n=1 Tax=Paludibacillus litoralis TaxID=3133267 RepID=UPI0030EDCB4D
MTDLTNYGENLTAEAALGGGAFYVALHSEDPTETGAVGEISGDGAAREATSFTVTGDTAASDAELVFGPATADKGTVTHVSVWDAATGGNCICKRALAAGAAWPSGTLTFEAGAVTLTMS